MDQHTPLLLGIDIGTSNIKGVLATPAGHVLAQANFAYDTHFVQPGWVEQAPEDWWRGVVAVTRQLCTDVSSAAQRIAGIGVSGQGCAVTLIDNDGDTVRPAIIWMDARSEPQCEQLRQTCGPKILQINGKQPGPYNSDPTLMWLQAHEPESIAKARCSLTSTGYINFRLTDTPIENVSDASILFAFDLAKQQWSNELIDAFGLPRKLYPKLAECIEIIGELTPTAAVELGIPAGIPIVAGGEDTSSAGLAIGVTQPGQALLSLGTAGTIYASIDRPVVDPTLLAFLHVLPAQTLLGGTIGAVGGAFQWCQQLLGQQRSYDELAALAATSPPGANGVIFLPYLSGELQPINDGNARSLFIGLNMNTTEADLIRAVLEGAAFAIAHNIDVMEAAGVTIDEIRAVGGPAQSEFWCQIMADICGRPIKVLDDNAGAPLGNCLLASAGVGLIDELAQTAHNAATVSAVYAPAHALRPRYDALFAIYRDLYPQLKQTFTQIADYQARYSGS